MLPLTLASRYLLGRKLRTVLTTLAVVFGVMVIFGMNIILPTMLASFQAGAMAAEGVVDLNVFHKTGDAFPQQMLAKIQAVEGVRAAAAALNRSVNIPADFFDADPARPDRITVLKLIGIDPFEAKTIRTYPLMSGRYLEQNDTDAALISQSLADDLSLKVGDRLPLPTVHGLTRLTIVGIMLPHLGPGNEEVLVTLPQAQTLTAQPGLVNVIDITFASAEPAERDQIAQRIQAALGEDYQLGALLGSEQMFASLRAGQVAFSLFGALSLFMGAFIIFNTFRTVVVERRRDIGILRAVGASRSLIVSVILTEGLIQGVIGTLLGLILGYLAGISLLGALQPLLSQFLNLKIGAPVISPLILTISVLLGVGVTVFAGLIPAIRASHITPLEALHRSGAELEFMRGISRWFVAGLVLVIVAVLALFSGQIMLMAPGGVMFLAGVALLAPGLVRPAVSVLGQLVAALYARNGVGGLAQGNLTRQPSRVAVTASATMLGLAIVVAAGGLVASLTGTLGNVMQKSLDSDYLFIPPSVALWASNIGADKRLAESLAQIDGVDKVSTMRYAGALVNDKPISMLGIDPVIFPQVAGLHFQQGIDFLAYREIAEGRALIANGAFLTTTGTKVGDTVLLTTTHGKVSYRIVAMAADLLNVKINSAYISQANLQTDFDVTEDVFIQFNLKPGADAAATDAQIRAVAADYPQFRVVDGKVYYAQLRAEMDAIFSGMYFVLALLALPSLIAMLNTLAIGVLERTREMGMLRAVGATRKQIYSMVVSEALLLALIGAALGVLCGLYLGFVFVSGLQAIFPLGYTFPLTGIAAAIFIALFFGVLASLIPARQAARMNVVEALRYE